MKIIFIILLFGVLCSCNDNQINNSDNQEHFLLNKRWSNQLVDFYDYNMSQWIDMNDKIATLTNSQFGIILQIFSKTNGKFIQSKTLNVLYGSKIHYSDGKLAYNSYDGIDIYDISTNSIHSIKSSSFINNSISAYNDKLVFTSEDVNNYIYLILLDMNNLKQDTLLNVSPDNDHDKTVDIGNIFLYYDIEGKGFVYYNYLPSKPNDEGIKIYNLSTNNISSATNPSTKTENLFVVDKELFAFTNSNRDINKLNPSSLAIIWNQKISDISSYLNPKFNAVNNNILFYDNSAVLISKSDGSIIWNQKLDFPVNTYLITNALVLEYNNSKIKSLNLTNGKLSGYYPEYPIQFNNLSSFSDGQSIFLINFSKELQEYTQAF